MPRNSIAMTGHRTNGIINARLASQAAIPASNSALLSAKNIFTLSSKGCDGRLQRRTGQTAPNGRVAAPTLDHPPLLIHRLRRLTDTHPPKKGEAKRPLLFYFLSIRHYHLGVVPVGLAPASTSGTMQITAPLDTFPVPFATEHPPREGGAQELPGQVPIGWLAMKLLNSS